MTGSTYDEVMIHSTAPRRVDADGDGLSDLTELLTGTDPCNPDSDGLADSIDPQLSMAK